MKKPCVPYGSDVSAGEFECADCGKRIKMASRTSLPPCPKLAEGSLSAQATHTKRCWIVLSGRGDDIDDPYPNR